MGQRGKARMPNSLRLLTGDRNQDRYNHNEPVPLEGDLEPPMNLDPDVARVWAERLVHLKAMNLAFPSDVDSWRAFCEAVVIHEKACDVLAHSPILVKGLHGGLVRNPALQIQRDSALTLLRFAAQFGLTPSARSTVEAAKRGPVEEVNPFAGAV